MFSDNVYWRLRSSSIQNWNGRWKKKFYNYANNTVEQQKILD